MKKGDIILSSTGDGTLGKCCVYDLKIPANRLAANGFGEFQPIDDRDTPEAYKTNRRIELKFTEK